MAGCWAIIGDPGIDDAVALAVLAGLGAVPDLVVSEPGNVDGATAARNLAGLVGLLGWDVPVRGCGVVEPAPVRSGRSSRHGPDGLGGVAHRLPLGPEAEPLGELPPRLLVTGSLAAVEAAEEVERLLWMGGSLAGGNITADAEFNAWCAPEAADRVLAAHAPATTVVPLDVTARVVLTDQDLGAWRGGGEVARLLAAATSHRRDHGGLTVHDAVAAVAWVRPDLFGWDQVALRCSTAEGWSRGALRVEGPGLTAVAVGVAAEEVRATIVDAVLACP